MFRAYCGEPKECKEEDLKRWSKLFESIDMNIVFVHTEVKPTAYLEVTADTIDTMELKNPTATNQPLQKNSFYSYTPMEKVAGSDKLPIMELLRKASPMGKQFKVLIPLALPQQKDCAEFPKEDTIVKDILFIEENSQKEVGWYNFNANILWIGDVFHFLDHVKNILPEIITPIEEVRGTGRITDNLSIGADPEFEIIDDTNKLVGAQYVLPKRDGEIGCDGHADTGEFRPKPGRNPLILSRNIKRLVRKLNSMPGVRGNQVWAGGGVKVTTGGHIHFGMKNMSENVKDALYDLVAAPILKYQSNFRNEHQGRTIQKGGDDAVRQQPHGMEWRVLPSFVINEDITTAVLCTTYAIVKSIKFHDYKYKVPSTAAPTREDFEKIPLYHVYKEWIDRFISLFLERGVMKDGKKFFKRNILEEWKCPKLRTDFTVAIFSDEQWVIDYFKPVNVSLNKTVKLSIRFSGDRIYCEGIPDDGLNMLGRFSDKHYLPDVNYPGRISQEGIAPQPQDPMEDEEEEPALNRDVRGTTPKKPKALISLPQAWRKANKKIELCKELKTIVQSIIIQLGE